MLPNVDFICGSIHRSLWWWKYCLVLSNRCTFGHESLFGHINNIDPAVNLDDAFSNWVYVYQPGIHCLNVFVISHFEALITLLYRHVGVIATAAETSYAWTPCLYASEYISAALLNRLIDRALIVPQYVLKPWTWVHYYANKYYKTKLKDD